MNRLLIPASFLAAALPAAHSFLVTDTGIRSWNDEQAASGIFFTRPLPPPVIMAEPLASDDPAWYSNYE